MNNKKLATITTQYSKFTDNQVLTKGQLNEFLDYFVDQDHLSRINLSGVGIVCGFDITYIEGLVPSERNRFSGGTTELIRPSSQATIIVSPGCGITTDGDIVVLTETVEQLDENENIVQIQQLLKTPKEYTHYRDYTNDDVKYKPFFYIGDDQITIHELFSTNEHNASGESYTNLNELEDLNDKVVVLYLENYAKEGDLCTALNCDNQGIEQIAKVRMFLVSSADAKKIAGHDSIFSKHNWYESYTQLPEVALQRDILNSENTETFKKLRQVYYNIIKNSNTIPNVTTGLNTVLQKFGKAIITDEINDLFTLSNVAIPLDYQYRFDVLKDLIAHYNEIRSLVLDINVECCPEIGAFPKHLLLGELVITNPHTQVLRHNFYKSPIIGHEDDNYKRLLHLLDSTSSLIKGYQEETNLEKIKITPSQGKGILGNKAIPAYFDVTDEFIQNWSYDKTSQYDEKYNLSYHRENLSERLSIQDPLLFDIDQNDFLRIEGIHGKLYRDALEQLQEQKKKHGLNFDIKVLSVDPTTQSINLSDYNCEFEDLNVLLKAWTTEQECILASMASFFSGFSTDTVGGNVRDVDYTQVTPHDAVHDTPTGNVRPGNNVAFPSSRFDEYTSQKLPRKTYKENVVKKNLTVQENTVGFYMNKAIESNTKGSYNDIKNAAKQLIRNVVTTQEWEAKPAVRDLAIYNAIDLMALTYILTERVPQSLSEIDELNINTYEVTLEQVCELVRNLKVTYQTVDLDDTLKDILGLLINQLSSVCCSGEKLTILLDEIEKRKEKILKNIKLSEFIKKHPGLRHRAGVQPGGTFVMAYLTQNAVDQDTYETVTMELDFLEQPNIDDDGTDGDEGILQLWSDQVSTRFAFLHKVTNQTQNPRSEIVIIGDTIDETVSNFSDFLNNIWSRAGATRYCKAQAEGKKLIISLKDQNIRKKENFILFFNPAITGTNRKQFFEPNEVITVSNGLKNTVIADFALPYMCCSDCSPVNFVIPKEPVFLSLPAAHICLDEDTLPIPFTISPIDGEVKALVPDGLNGGVIQDENGKYFFDATVLDPSLYETPINFTVNNEITAATITVYNKVEATITTTVTYNTDGTLATVIFKFNDPNFASGTTFTWNLGNGQTSNNVPNANGEIIFTYDIPVNASNTVQPSVSIGNGPCSTEIILDEIVFEDPDNSLVLEEREICLDGTIDEVRSIPYNVQPAGATLEVNNDLDGVTIEEEHITFNSRFFTAYDTPVSFIVNGEVLAAPTVIVRKRPVVADFSWTPNPITIDQGTSEVTVDFTINNLSSQEMDRLSFEWNFGDENGAEGINPTHTYTIPDSASGSVTFNVTLIVKGNPCEEVVRTHEVTVNINQTEFSLNLNTNEICLDPNEPFTGEIGYSTVPEGATVALADNSVEGLTIGTSGITFNSGTFSPFHTPITFTVDGNNVSETLIVRELLSNASFNWTPENPEVFQGQDTVSITFNTQNISAAQLAHVAIKWKFSDGQAAEGTSPNMTFNVPNDVSGSFQIGVQMFVIGAPCADVIVSNEVVVKVANQEPPGCEGIIGGKIDDDRDRLREIHIDLGSELIEAIEQPTVKLFDDHVLQNKSGFLAGARNGDLPEMFVPLIGDTATAMKNNAPDPGKLEWLAILFETQIELFYDILHCQSDARIEGSAGFIKKVVDHIITSLNLVIEVPYNREPLKQYFNAYLEDPAVSNLLKDRINNEILPLL